MFRRKWLLSLAAVVCLVGLEAGATTSPPRPEAPCCCYDSTCPPGCAPGCPPDCLAPSCGSCRADQPCPAQAPKATVCPACPFCPAW
jgi:hypothetical protein